MIQTALELKKNIKSLTKGLHGDPFSILGIHQVKKDNKNAIAIRAFIPGVRSVSVVTDDGTETKMKRLDPDGFYEAVFTDKKSAFSYKYHIVTNSKKSIYRYDPYSFEPLISDFDLQIWGEGNHAKAYQLMGTHIRESKGVKGTHFVVSAPAATRVSVVGDFNNWDGRVYPMRKYHEQGIWEIFIPDVDEGSNYKYEVKVAHFELPLLKADPYGFCSEKRPSTASVVYSIDGYDWKDESWIKKRADKQSLNAPVSVYEIHLGSWKRKKDGSEDGFLSYRELADELVPYVKSLGYTHIELLPIAEHPYDPSWGYQITGYYAPTSRYGSPKDFMHFVDVCHQNDIGVILDWVPAHFAKDEHGLYNFDGTHLYEHADPRQGEHKDWGTSIFNYGRTEVKNFLISNGLFWFDYYHIDGLRVDAVASMLYLDYSREENEWIPNKYGGRENLEAIDFLRKFNEVAHLEYPGIVTAAEESTAWPMVSKPTYMGGLGFDYKWNMGWMNDTLKYMEIDPVFRKHHHNQITFSLIYAFTENFILPFSHDEVVHMKHSMLSKMPGDDWQKMANFRLLLTYMFMHPGKKLLFMGCEIGQWSEWNSQWELEWNLLEWDSHRGIQNIVRELNNTYKREPSMYEVDYDWQGFEWIDFSDVDNSVISFSRFSNEKKESLIGIFNFTPVVRNDYKIGVPEEGIYNEILNSDSVEFGGSNVVNSALHTYPAQWQGKPFHLTLTLPPLAGIILKKS